MLDRDKYLSKAEAKQLRKWAKEKGSEIEWAVIDFLLNTGARASECRKVKIKDLNLSREPTITVLGKGKKLRTITISNQLKKHLQKFIVWKESANQDVNPDSYLFLSKMGNYYSLMGMQQLFKRVAKRAGLRSVYSIHSLRHAFGFLIFQKSKNIRLTQLLLGHQSLNTTMIYTHVSEKEISQTVNGLWR